MMMIEETYLIIFSVVIIVIDFLGLLILLMFVITYAVV